MCCGVSSLLTDLVNELLPGFAEAADRLGLEGNARWESLVEDLLPPRPITVFPQSSREITEDVRRRVEHERHRALYQASREAWERNVAAYEAGLGLAAAG